MTEEEFDKQLAEGKAKFQNENFCFDLELNRTLAKSLTFKECNFEQNLSLKNVNSFYLTFSQCSFDEINISGSTITSLIFNSIQKINYFFISNTEIAQFQFKNSENPEAEFKFIFTKISQSLFFQDVKIKSFLGEINWQEDAFQDVQLMFRNSTFENFNLNESKVGEFDFQKNTVSNTMECSYTVFQKAYLNESCLGLKSRFVECEFNSNVSLKKCTSLDKTNLNINICIFRGHTFFTIASLKNIVITDTTFESRVSFLGLEVKNINIHLVNFNKLAHFDDVKINNIAECDRKTLRAIKQELQKTDNKIDYNRFRAYELAAYYRELKWFGDFRDKFVLGATILSTGYNHSWRRAFLFTVCFGVFWYSILYFSEYNGAYNPEKVNEFFTGAFRFFLVTDFSSPFKAKGTYLENAWMWIPLVLGKIFIAFGIYEMIQAFRKFKA